jgi:hypothetical protein
MIVGPQDYLVRVCSPDDTLYINRGTHGVPATGRDGAQEGGADHGLFVHETRLLSRLPYLINDGPPCPAALSNVEPNTWRGYCIALPPCR